MADRKEDRRLVESILGGNLDAFSQIVKNYQRPIYYLSLRMLKNPEVADDITQKTFLKAYRALAGFQFKSSLKTWLTAIALNLCRTEYAKPKRETAELHPNISNTQFEEQQEREEHQHKREFLRQALENLPMRQKEVVTLRIYQEMPFKEIAEALNSTESAVKVNFHHAMKSLREWTQQRILRVGRGVRDDFLDRPGGRDFGRTDGPTERHRCGQRLRAGHPRGYPRLMEQLLFVAIP